jgi:hypothetical protein
MLVIISIINIITSVLHYNRRSLSMGTPRPSSSKGFISIGTITHHPEENSFGGPGVSESVILGKYVKTPSCAFPGLYTG